MQYFSFFTELVATLPKSQLKPHLFMAIAQPDRKYACILLAGSRKKRWNFPPRPQYYK